MIRIHTNTHIDADDADKISARWSSSGKIAYVQLGNTSLYLAPGALVALISALDAVNVPKETES